jgi:AraC-like DNA-binding protein
MTARLPSLRFETAALPAGTRIDAVQDAMGAAYDVATPAHAPDDPFTISSGAWLLNGTLINSRVCSPLRMTRTRRRIRADGLDHYLIVVTRAGSWSAETDGGQLSASGSDPGSVAIWDMTKPLDVSVTASISVGCTVQRDALDALLPAGGIQQGTQLRGGAAALLADYIALLERRLPDLNAEEAPFVERATLGIMAACIAPTLGRLEQAAAPVDAALRRQATRLVDAALADPSLSPDRLADGLRISRAALYRLLEAEGGVAAFIWKRRLDHAMRLLSDPAERRRVSQIAEACGFSSDAHFSRSFRRVFGMAPTEWRATPMTARPPMPSQRDDVLGLYRRWVRHLAD